MRKLKRNIGHILGLLPVDMRLIVGKYINDNIYPEIDRIKNCYEPKTKYEIIDEYAPDWFRCKDVKTGGICIVHRSQL